MFIRNRSIHRSFLILIILFVSIGFVLEARAQDYNYRRSITVDRTKVANPSGTFPIAFDAVSSAKTADAGASNLSWSHSVGSGNDKIAIVSVSTQQATGAAVVHDRTDSTTTGTGTNTLLSWSHTVGSGSNRVAVVSVADFRTDPAFTGTATGSNTFADPANTLSWQHTVGTLSNGILVVGVAINRNTAPNNQTVQSVTWNGTGLTKLGEVPNGANCTAELWYLTNPASGTFNIIVTLAGGATAHGSLEIWRGLLSSEDVETLVNGMRLPFFVSMTCLNGFFQNPYSETLAETLMKAPQGGAVAVWTSSGLTEPDKQALMNKELIRLLFGRESLTLGEATAKAKTSVSDQDIRRTWILFGDPATRLK